MGDVFVSKRSRITYEFLGQELMIFIEENQLSADFTGGDQKKNPLNLMEEKSQTPTTKE